LRDSEVRHTSPPRQGPPAPHRRKSTAAPHATTHHATASGYQDPTTRTATPTRQTHTPKPHPAPTATSSDQLPLSASLTAHLPAAAISRRACTVSARRLSAHARSICDRFNPSSSKPTSVSASHG